MGRAYLIGLAAVVTAVAFAGPAQADLSAVSTVVAAPGLDPAGTGLAAWYQDANGMQLTLCEDGTPACLGATPGDLTNPAAGELFYSRAVADFRGPNGERFVEVLSLQAGLNTGGKPIAFQRIRFRVVAGQPNATYSVVEPYGTQSVDTNATGTGTTTQDIGCAPLGIVACDFTLALATGAATPDGSVGPFIMWDAGAPAGYVGTPATAHTVIGSPTGNNFVSVSGPALPAGGFQTNLFKVTGKIAAIIPAFGGAPVAFAKQLVATTSAARTATVTNTGLAALAITAIAPTGANAADYAIAPGSDTCTGASVPAGGTCTVGVTFTPGAAGARSAALAVTDNAGGSPHTIVLTGSGVTPPAAPTATPAPGTYTGAQSVTLSGPDPAAAVHYTVDGTSPTASSPTSPNPIMVTGSRTIKAIAIDANGNASSVADLGYQIAPVPAVSPITVARTRSAPLALSALSVSKRYKLKLARRRGLRLTLGLPAGTRSAHVQILRHAKVIYATDVRTPATAGPYTITLKPRHLTAGRYHLDVALRGADGVLGTPSAAAFTIRR